PIVLALQDPRDDAAALRHRLGGGGRERDLVEQDGGREQRLNALHPEVARVLHGAPSIKPPAGGTGKLVDALEPALDQRQVLPVARVRVALARGAPELAGPLLLARAPGHRAGQREARLAEVLR